MDLNFLSPFIRIAMDSLITPPWRLHERVLFDYELLYIKNGEVMVSIENETYHGIPGDIFLFKPMQNHSIDIIGGKPLRQPHIHFDLFYQHNSPDVKISFKSLEYMTEGEKKLFRDDITNEIFNPFPSHIRLQNPLTLEKMLFNVIHEYNNRVPFYEVAIKGLFIQLWTQLLREIYWINNKQVLPNMDVLNKVKNYLDFNPGQKITLDDLAEFAHLSKFYLSHLFKKAFGVTPIQYHLMVRIIKAKENIQFTSLSITEIAEKLGFQNICSFSRAFKKQEKVPPTFYRR